MTTSSDARPYGHDLYLNPNGTFALTITFVGVSVVNASYWSGIVVHHAADAPAATLFSPAIAVNTTPNTVTVTFSSANLTALLSTGTTKWLGYWHLQNSLYSFPFIGGRLTVDRNGVASGSNGALTLTVTSSSITANVTAGVAQSAFFSAMAYSLEEIIVGTITRDANEAVTSAQVVWPDGTTGVFTATTLSTLFPGAVDAYTVTYLGATTVTYTQPLMTRDTSGAVTVRPAITVS